MNPATFIHVPKTGGSSIIDIFGHHIHSKGHQPAEKYPEAEWKFAFSRNPWDRAVSLYYWRDVPKVPFKQWLYTRGTEMLREQKWSIGQILCYSDGTLMVDTIYEFAEFEESVADIAFRLDIESVDLFHRNTNPFKPADLDYRSMYTDAKMVDAIGELCHWEIERFGYTF